MAETIGSLIDKLSIVELRRWHAEEAMLNPEAPEDVRHECALRLAIIDEQRSDLIRELDELWTQVLVHGRAPKVYRQLKMYNDPRLRTASNASSPATPTPERRPDAHTHTHPGPGVIDMQKHRTRKPATAPPTGSSDG